MSYRVGNREKNLHSHLNMYCLSIYHLFICLYLYLLASLLIFQLSTLPYYPLFEGLLSIAGTRNLIFQNPLPHRVSGQSLPSRSCAVFGKWTGEEVFVPGRLWQPNTMASQISSQGPPWLLQTETKPWDSNRWNFLANLRDWETCLFQCFGLKSSDSLTSYCSSSLTQLFLYSYYFNFLKKKPHTFITIID